jgi:calcium/calmodulin-dependent protein kinase (CaM kinase) II
MPDADELLQLNQQLLDCIADGEWDQYRDLCDPTLTAFEPEACGRLVSGLDFHYFYFEVPGPAGRNRTTMSNPHVRVMGDAAVVTYVRINQRARPDGSTHSSAYEETRVWQRTDGRWRHVHFHRSPVK